MAHKIARPEPGWNWLAAETGIVTRLKERLQSGPGAWAREVATREALSSVAEEMQNCPAVYLVYDGYSIANADEQRALIVLRFIATLAIGNAVQGRDASPRNQTAGVLLPGVFKALHGYRPPECATGLVPTSPPRPYYSEARFAYFPTAWETTLIYSTRQGPVFARRPGQT
jgi:hypothetical protein